MRVGMFIDANFPPHPRVENEAVSLLENGHQVIVFVPHYSQSQPPLEDHKGVQIVRIKANKLVYKLSALANNYPFYRWWFTPLIQKAIKNYGLEVLHIHNITIAGPVFAANKKHGLPVVLDIHENLPEIMKFYPHVRRLPGKFIIDLKKWKEAEKRYVRKADKIVVVTQEAKMQLIKDYGTDRTKIIVLPNTIHPSIFYTEFNAALASRFAGKYNLLYVGDTGLRRGLDIVIQALKQIKAEVPEVNLIVVGASKDDAYLRQLAKTEQVEECISFEGWQDFSNFRTYIACAAICLSPIRRNPHHDTTYANKLFQYMALGRPLVVSDSTAQARLIKDLESGLVYSEDKPEELAERVAFLYQHPEIAKELGENGKKALDNQWNWYTQSLPFVAHYNALAENYVHIAKPAKNSKVK